MSDSSRLVVARRGLYKGLPDGPNLVPAGAPLAENLKSAVLDVPLARRLAVLLSLAEELRPNNSFLKPFVPPTMPPLSYDVARDAVICLGEGERPRLPGEAPRELNAEEKLLAAEDQELELAVIKMQPGDVVPRAAADEIWARGLRNLGDILGEAVESARKALSLESRKPLPEGEREAISVKLARVDAFDARVERFRRKIDWLADYVANGGDFFSPALWALPPWSMKNESCVLSLADEVEVGRLAEALLREGGAEVLLPRVGDVFRRLGRFSHLESRQTAPEKAQNNLVRWRGRRAPGTASSRRDARGYVVLREDERAMLFAECRNSEGSAGDRAVGIRPGSVIVLPKGAPAYFRGRGFRVGESGAIQRLGRDGALTEAVDLALVGVLQNMARERAGAFKKRRSEISERRKAAGVLGPRPAARSAEPVYCGGYRWFFEPWWGELCDEASDEVLGRIGRLWRSLMGPVVAGEDPDRIYSLEARPWGWRGRNAWEFAGPGREPGRVQQYIGAALEARPADFFVAQGGDRRNVPWPMRGYAAHGLERISYVGEPASFEREWQEPKHDWRWLGDCLGPEMMETPFIRRLVGLGQGAAGDRQQFEALLEEACASIHPDQAAFGLQQVDAALKFMTSVEAREAVAWRGRVEERRAKAYAAWRDEMRETCRIAYVPDPTKEAFEIRIEPWDDAFMPESLPKLSEAAMPCGPRVRGRYEGVTLKSPDGREVASYCWDDLRKRILDNYEKLADVERWMLRAS